MRAALRPSSVLSIDLSRLPGRSYAGLIVAVAVLALVLAWTDVDQVTQLLEGAGPAILALALLHPFQVLPNALAWRILFRAGQRPSPRAAIVATWIGLAINQLLPTAGIADDIAKARLVAPATGWVAAAAALVVDKTVQALAVLAMAILGVLLLLASTANPLHIATAAAGTGALALGIAGFVVVQRTRLLSSTSARLAAVAEAKAPSFLRDVEDLVRERGGRIGLVGAAVLLRVAALVLLTVEVWLAALLLGLPLSLADALLLRSVAFAARGAAFFVWAGLGVQEGVYAALGPLLALDAASLVALSLTTRLREVLAGLPALALWVGLEASRRP